MSGSKKSNKKLIQWHKIADRGYHGYVGDVCMFYIHKHGNEFGLEVGLPNAEPNLYGRLYEQHKTAASAAKRSEEVLRSWLIRLKSRRKQKLTP